MNGGVDSQGYLHRRFFLRAAVVKIKHLNIFFMG
jgi:hypothetical protein